MNTIDDGRLPSGRAVVNGASEAVSALRASVPDAGDTQFHDPLDRYLRVVESAGFEKVFEQRFESRDGEYDTYYIYARRDGLLLEFDSFWQWSDRCATTVNGGKLYYNWLPLSRGRARGATSSGGYHDHEGVLIWVGDHDCREFLLRKISRLEEGGRFLPKWIKRPGAFWLTHYADMKEEEGETFRARVDNWERLTAERLSELPQWVQDMVTPAQGTETGTAETEGLGPKDDGPVPNGDAPND